MAGEKKKAPANEQEQKKLNARIKRETNRLNKIFTAKSEEEKSYLEGLIKRAAFMKIQLEDMEKDLVTNGWTEMFTQSVYSKPYERERPAARMYNSVNKNYQTLMRQLADFVDRTNNAEKEPDDGFESFCDQ